MNDFSKMFEQMMEQSQKMAAAFNPAMTSFQPQGFEKMMPAMPTMPKEFMDMVFGNAFNKDGLDSKTRMLVLVAGMTVQGALAEPAFKLTVRNALAAGATPQEVGEVIYQMSMLGGLPSMTRALGFAQSVFGENEEKDA